MKSLHFRGIASILLCYVLLIIVTIWGYSISYSQVEEISENSHVSVQEIDKKLPSGIPVQIAIPSLELNIPISIGTYDTESDSWNISNQMAYFASESADLLSESGTTVIYAHNKPNLFGQLKSLNLGDVITITDEYGNFQEYSFASKEEVNPHDTSVFKNNDQYRVALLTCTGFLDQKRLLVYFIPAVN